MGNIKVADSIIPSKVNTPLDPRSRVATEADILNIEVPAVGQIIYCIETDKFYVIKSLASKAIGALVVPDVAVGEYDEFTVDLSDEKKALIVRELQDYVQEEFVKGSW
ncbi:MAG: hypothetical protein J6W00_10870 [Lentisphaeria bacterium]|nr:hypothetical protein [Lentisphaeria bacterium]